MSMPEDAPQLSGLQQQAAAFRQTTGGGVPATVYIQKEGEGFRMVVKMNDGTSGEALAGYLADILGSTCQAYGMTVKV
jgi:hypothetical protein